MSAFWDGFYKKAVSCVSDTKDSCVQKSQKHRTQDPMEEWEQESEAYNQKNQSGSGDLKLDPVVIASSFTPDTYWRTWP